MSFNWTRKRKTLAILLIPLEISLVLILFAWPRGEAAPRELPVGLVLAAERPAASGVATPLEQQLRARGFDVTRYATPQAAQEAIEQRHVYGALVSQRRPTLLVSTAASPQVAQLLRGQLASAAPGRERRQAAEVRDVVAADPDDPQGAVLGASVLPFLIGGILAGLVAIGTSSRARGRLAILLGVAIAAGICGALVLESWLGAFGGHWLAVAGIYALLVLAIGSTVAGAGAWLGLPGVGAAAIVMVLLGNPWSGVAQPAELMPSPSAEIGALLPPGAATDAVRGSAFFDGAGTGEPLGMLALWAVGGSIAVGAAGPRLGRSSRPRRSPLARSGEEAPAT